MFARGGAPERRREQDHAASCHSPVRPTAAVTGLAAEACIVRRIGWRAVAVGGDADRTRRAIAQLIAEGASALVSFGICGGLDPALGSGALILPHAVSSEDGRHRRVHAALRGALPAPPRRARIPPAGRDVLRPPPPPRTPP